MNRSRGNWDKLKWRASPQERGMSLRVALDTDLSCKDSFDFFTSHLEESLESRGIKFGWVANGKIIQEEKEIGAITKLVPPSEIEIEWLTGSTWIDSNNEKLKINFEPLENKGTRISLEIQGWERVTGDAGNQLLDWFSDQLAAQLIMSISPLHYINWLTDRRVRKPSGQASRETYRNPLYHRPNFLAILGYLNLDKEDYLMEVGCGGGAFLHDVLESGCKAAAIDHSPDMVKLAREVNSKAIEEKRLEIVESEADSIPYSNDMFTCAVSTGVFCFIERPVTMLSEIRRVLKKDGRLILFTGSKELKGTPAAPEPIASQLHLYEDEELVKMAREAGFHEARVERPSLEAYARKAGVPEDALELFAGHAGQFLLARKT